MSDAHKIKTHNVIPAGQVMRPNSHRPEPYVHQPFPTVRYAPDGSTTEVQNQDELDELGPEWREFPYPKKAVAAAGEVPATRAQADAHAELLEAHAALKDAHANLQASHDALANDKATLRSELEELASQHKQAVVAAQSAQKQLAMVRGQLNAARKRAGEPEVAEGDGTQTGSASSGTQPASDGNTPNEPKKD